MNDKENSLDEASYRAMNDCLEFYLNAFKLEIWHPATIEFVYWLEKDLWFKGFPKIKTPT